MTYLVGMKVITTHSLYSSNKDHTYEPGLIAKVTQVGVDDPDQIIIETEDGIVINTPYYKTKPVTKLEQILE